MAGFDDVIRLGGLLPEVEVVRLAVVEEADLADFLEDAYRRKAPATLLRQLDA